MWSREAAPIGSVAEQSSRRTMGNVLHRIPDLPGDEPRARPLVMHTRLTESRSLHPYALALGRRAQSRPTTPAPWTHQSLILSTLCALGDYRFSSTREKRYDPQDPTFVFVDTQDELDFFYEEFESRRALMSCGHAVTPTSLTNWCLKLLDEGESRFVCGQTGCNVEWSYEEVCKMALLTPEEKKLFVKAMSYNAGHASRSVNNGCCNESLQTLQTCPEILISSVKCPSIRACPTCGILQQLDNKSCKNVYCPRCKKYFCFVCLSVTNLHQCSVAAPRQTSVPVWKKE